MSDMEYFVLEHDRRLPANGGNLAFSDRMLRGYRYAEQQEIVYAKTGSRLSHGSLIEQPLLLVSEELRTLITQIAPEIAYKRVLTIDLEQQVQFPYAWMDFQEIACAAPDRTGMENGRISRMVINPDVLGEAAIFQIPYYRSRVLVARVDMAESLLRKSLYGLSIRRIQLIGGEG
ncbi:MAG: hypothetical protein ACE3L7_03000 [Candidatus Pristimantibacillus sp.]